jgi:hypothetical protein
MEELDDLKMSLVGIACKFEPDNCDFICVLNENEQLEQFNPEE